MTRSTRTPTRQPERSLGAGAVGLATTTYMGLAIAMSWPLLTVMTTSVAGDLGDPLLVIWVMTSVSRGLTRVLGGHWSAFAEMWNANIFYPEPNTLAYSEHFAGQTLLSLPVWWATGNPILIYNVAVLLSFVLTALATFLLTRAFTGGMLAPLAAGAFAAFNSYRLGLELSHLHVLTIQWFPLALLAVHRYVERGGWRWLAAVVGCVVLMNLSSGYFMLYGAPLIAVFAVCDMAIQQHLRDVERWLGFAVAVPATLLLTAPFILPYLEMRRQTGFLRPMQDVIAHSARFEQYATFVLPWAQVPIALAILAIATAAMRRAAVSGAYVAAVSVVLALAFVLSLGPYIQPWGIPGPYLFLYKYVPGFTGLRVVNRYGALVLIILPVVAGFGAAAVVRWRRFGPALIGLALAVFLWQVWPARFPIDVPLPSADLEPALAYLEPAPELPGIYQAVAALHSDAVLLELPFGDYWYDLRYMFFSAIHGRRLVNGYSGVFPASYLSRQGALARPLLDPERAARALTGATHVIVHRRAWRDDTGTKIASWLESLGAHIVTGSGDALLYQVGSTERLAAYGAAAP